MTKSDFRNATQYYIEPEFTKINKAKFSMPEAMSFFSAIDIVVE